MHYCSTSHCNWLLHTTHPIESGDIQPHLPRIISYHGIPTACSPQKQNQDCLLYLLQSSRPVGPFARASAMHAGERQANLGSIQAMPKRHPVDPPVCYYIEHEFEPIPIGRYSLGTESSQYRA